MKAANQRLCFGLVSLCLSRWKLLAGNENDDHRCCLDAALCKFRSLANLILPVFAGFSVLLCFLWVQGVLEGKDEDWTVLNSQGDPTLDAKYVSSNVLSNLPLGYPLEGNIV